jgi:hypothetical protein
LFLKVDTTASSNNHNIKKLVDKNINRMHNNQLILNNPQNNKDKRLQQFYSIYNCQNDPPKTSVCETTTQSSTLSSNTNLYYDHNNLPLNNKIQLLKLKFNQLNQSSNHLGNSIQKTSDTSVKSSRLPHAPLTTSTSTSILTSTTVLPNNYQYQRPHSKETIIEECKQSLDELMKASKWPSTSFDNSSTSHQHNLNDQLTDSNNSFSNSYKSSLQLKLKSNDSINLAGKTFFFFFFFLHFYKFKYFDYFRNGINL